MNAVKMGMTVRASDGVAGRVDDVLLDGETGQPAYVVVDAAGFFARDVVVAYDNVRNVDDAGVWLGLTRDEVKGAPAYDAARYGRAAGLLSAAAARVEED